MICACGRVYKPLRKRPSCRVDRADGVIGKLIYRRRCSVCRRLGRTRRWGTERRAA